MKVVINTCCGRFELSDKAYERLGELGIPIRKYVEPVCGPNGLYLPEPANDGDVIFDHRLTPRGANSMSDACLDALDRGSIFVQRYCETFIDRDPQKWRTDPRLIQVVEELGAEANGPSASLRIVEIPDGVSWEISEYDGMERVEEVHRSWS